MERSLIDKLLRENNMKTLESQEYMLAYTDSFELTQTVFKFPNSSLYCYNSVHKLIALDDLGVAQILEILLFEFNTNFANVGNTKEIEDGRVYNAFEINNVRYTGITVEAVEAAINYKHINLYFDKNARVNEYRPEFVGCKDNTLYEL